MQPVAAWSDATVTPIGILPSSLDKERIVADSGVIVTITGPAQAVSAFSSDGFPSSVLPA